VPAVTDVDARRLLRTARVARLATVGASGQPHIVPVTFAVDGDVLYSAVDAKPKTTRALARLRNIRADDRVAVLADHYAEDWAALWWVRADGRAAIIDDRAAMAGPIRLLAQRYPQYAGSPPAGPVIAITVGHWTGWAAAAH
jgi:PPOX class probable F420-dependent enzyme